MTFLTYEILKEMIVRNELNRTHRHREGTYGWGAYDWEKRYLGVWNGHTLLYFKWMTNKDLLYSEQVSE